MSRESYAWFTGLFVIALGLALVGMARYLGSYGVAQDTYTVVSQGSVAGLNPEANVIFRGVPAGKVTSIRFDPDDVHSILVDIAVDRGLPITRGTYAMLRVQALTGLAQIELADTGDQPEPLPTRSIAPARIPMRPSPFEQLTASAQELLPRLAELAGRLSAFADDKNRARWESILGNADNATRELVSLQATIRSSLEGIPQLSKSARQTLLEIKSLARDMNQTSREIRSLSNDTEHLVTTGKDGLEALNRRTIPKTEALLQELQRATASVRRFSQQLETDPQVLLLGRDAPPPGPGEPGFNDPP